MSEMNCYSPADMAAVMNGGNNGNQWNNPIWLLWALLFGRGGFGFGNGAAAGAAVQDAEIQGQLNAIRQTMADNQNANALGAGISGNHEALHGVFGALNTGFDGVNASINGASTTNLMGQKDLQAAIQSCCCNNQTAILNQTNQLQSSINDARQATVNGFANMGYIIAQQTNDLQNTANANTQKILDKMCQTETQELRDKLAALSQSEQTTKILSAVAATGGCGCNC